MAEKMPVILSQARSARPEQQELENALAFHLGLWPELDLVVVPHLYDLASDGPVMAELRAIQGDAIVLAYLYPRATFWLLDANGVRGRLGKTSSLPEEEADHSAVPAPPDADLPRRTLWCFDLRDGGGVERYLTEIGRIVGVPTVPQPAGLSPARRARYLQEATRDRWYPVVDRSRCGHCLECLNFCLFGVFGLSPDSAVLVEHPDACRDGCPACARICPSAAIMFPQHPDPAIAGDPNAARQWLQVGPAPAGGTGLIELATAERQTALQRSGSAQPPLPPKQQDTQAHHAELDRLVDELDDLDL